MAMKGYKFAPLCVCGCICVFVHLWTFPLHTLFPPFIILLFGDPHLLEGALIEWMIEKGIDRWRKRNREIWGEARDRSREQRSLSVQACVYVPVMYVCVYVCVWMCVGIVCICVYVCECAGERDSLVKPVWTLLSRNWIVARSCCCWLWASTSYSGRSEGEKEEETEK